MDWTRPLTLKEQQQIMAEVREKNRRDRLDRDEYVFKQGKAEGKVAGIAEGMHQAYNLNRQTEYNYKCQIKNFYPFYSFAQSQTLKPGSAFSV